jgi:hypothetical protein
MAFKKGHYGYVKKQKENYLKLLITGLALSVILLLSGGIFFESRANSLTIFGIILFFPTSIWGIRFYLFNKYKPLKTEEYENLKDQVSKESLETLLVDLILTNGDKGILHLPLTFVNKTTIYCYIREEDPKKIKAYLEALFIPKGISTQLILEKSLSSYIGYLDQETEEIDLELVKLLLIHSI